MCKRDGRQFNWWQRFCLKLVLGRAYHQQPIYYQGSYYKNKGAYKWGLWLNEGENQDDTQQGAIQPERISEVAEAEWEDDGGGG